MIKTFLKLNAVNCIDNCGENMFDYNSKPLQQGDNFKSNLLYLEIPREGSQCYYLIHKSTNKFQEKFIQIERRKQLISNISTYGRLDSKKYVLAAGVRVFWRKNGKGRMELAMNIYKASEIPMETGNFETKETQPPYLIIRTFGSQGYELKEGQVMKLGRMQYVITEVKAAPKIEDFLDGLQKEEILVVPPMLSKLQASYMLTPRQAPVQAPTACRICLMAQDTEEDRIIHPCKCQSSIGSMHVECFRHWMKFRLSKLRGDSECGAAFHTSLMTCEICKAELPKAIRVGQQTVPVLSFFEDVKPYLGILPRPIAPGQLANDSPVYITIDDDNRTTVGRLPESGVVIDELTVSRKHAIIRINEGAKVIVEDEKSKFGTLIYDRNAQIRLSRKMKAFQVRNTVFSWSLEERA